MFGWIYESKLCMSSNFFFGRINRSFWWSFFTVIVSFDIFVTAHSLNYLLVKLSLYHILPGLTLQYLKKWVLRSDIVFPSIFFLRLRVCNFWRSCKLKKSSWVMSTTFVSRFLFINLMTSVYQSRGISVSIIVPFLLYL